jgi:hypothetical protein
VNQSKLSLVDGALAACGVLALVWTFLSWWTWEVYFDPTDHTTMTVNAWDQANNGYMVSVNGSQSVNGPLAWMPMVLLFVLGITALLRTGSPQLLPGKLFYQVALAAGALGALLVVIRWSSLWKPDGWEPSDGGPISAGVGLYLGLLTALVVAAISIGGLRTTPMRTPVQGPPLWPYPYAYQPPQEWRPPGPPAEQQPPDRPGPPNTPA